MLGAACMWDVSYTLYWLSSRRSRRGGATGAQYAHATTMPSTWISPSLFLYLSGDSQGRVPRGRSMLCYMILLHDICYRTFSLLHGLLHPMCSYSVQIHRLRDVMTRRAKAPGSSGLRRLSLMYVSNM